MTIDWHTIDPFDTDVLDDETARMLAASAQQTITQRQEALGVSLHPMAVLDLRIRILAEALLGDAGSERVAIRLFQVMNANLDEAAVEVRKLTLLQGGMTNGLILPGQP